MVRTRRKSVLLVGTLGLLGMPMAEAADPPVPVLWEGRVVEASGAPAAAEVVAYARPAAADLPASGNALVPVARTTTDGAGHYVLRSGRTAALRAVEDEVGWSNVMVVAFGDKGGTSLAVDSIAWSPGGRWVTSPAERADPGSSVSDDALDREHPAVMTLVDSGKAGSMPVAMPPPQRQAGQCAGPYKTEDLGVHMTKVGELHLEKQWLGTFTYTTTKSTSFQVGFRAEGKDWSAGGSNSSIKGSSSSTGSGELSGPEMYSFEADIIYKKYTWKCNRAEQWNWVETVEASQWKGGIIQLTRGPAPACNPNFRSSIPPNGTHNRAASETFTIQNGISVLGFSGAVSTTMGKGVSYAWRNNLALHRELCGERAPITGDTRISSLP